MPKAALANTSRQICSPHPDAPLFAMIDQIAAKWRECRQLDEVEMTLSPAKRKRVKARGSASTHQACDLERRLIKTKPETWSGLHAKILGIKRAEFDDDDLPLILGRLADDVARIGAIS